MKTVELFRDYAEFKAYVEASLFPCQIFMAEGASPSGSGWWAIVIVG